MADLPLPAPEDPVAEDPAPRDPAPQDPAPRDPAPQEPESLPEAPQGPESLPEAGPDLDPGEEPPQALVRETSESSDPLAESPPASGGKASRLPLVALFLLGAASSVLVVFPRRYPVQTYATWCQLRYGGLPSAKGLLLSLRPCPPTLQPVEAKGTKSPGPWILLEHQNLAGAPNLVVLPERLGEELSLEVRADGQRVPPRADPAREAQAQALRPHLLGPRDRFAIPLDVSAYVELPEGWSRLEVVVARAQLGGDGHSCSARTVITRQK